MIHDESSWDIRQAARRQGAGGLWRHFKSFDGKERKFLAENSGGASWMTEYNVLAGLSSRSFGRFSYFVTRIASGRVERGLPMAPRRCGYNTVSLYPAYGAFMSARGFHTTTGIQHFYDAKDLGAKGIEPDSFFYDKASSWSGNSRRRRRCSPSSISPPIISRGKPNSARNCLPSWRAPGNEPSVDEYLRRQALSAEHYKNFVAELKKKFADQPS